MCHVGITGWFVDHKVLVYWVAAIAPGPLPSYVTGLALAPASPGHTSWIFNIYGASMERATGQITD
jgi:hypothetical protein